MGGRGREAVKVENESRVWILAEALNCRECEWNSCVECDLKSEWNLLENFFSLHPRISDEITSLCRHIYRSNWVLEASANFPTWNSTPTLRLLWWNHIIWHDSGQWWWWWRESDGHLIIIVCNRIGGWLFALISRINDNFFSANWTRRLCKEVWEWKVIIALDCPSCWLVTRCRLRLH